MFHGKIFLGPCGAKNPGIITSQKFKSTNYGTTLFIGMTKKEKAASRVGGLHVFKLVFEPLGYNACNIPNAVPGSLYKPLDMPLHRRLQEDVGVTAPEGYQHVVGHRLCQSVAILLQAGADGLLQHGYLPPDRVKKRENDTNFWCHVPSPDRAEAEGRQSSVCVAQEAPNALCFSSSGGLEVL
jgi:hypothetical protein